MTSPGPAFPAARAIPAGAGPGLEVNRRRWTRTAAPAAGVFVAAFGWRFLTPDFKNDHFVHLAKAMQLVQFGELPLRDFEDPLHLLKIFFSAGAQAVLGRNLLSEAILIAALLAAAAALVFLAARRATASTGLALLASSAAIVIAPRLYNYQKVLVPALALPLLWRYVDRPSTGRLAAVCFSAALGVGFRLDQGATVIAAALVMLLAVHIREGPKRVAVRLLAAAALGTLFLLPWAAFVAASGGLAGNIQKTLEIGEREANRTVLLPLPRFQLRSLISLVFPPRHGPVEIRWRGSLSDEKRREIEGRHSLAHPQWIHGTTWHYDVRDLSAANLRMLVDHPSAAETRHIDLKNLRIEWDARKILGINAAVLLYYVFFLLPPLAVVGVLFGRRPGRPPSSPAPLGPAHLLTAAALALVMDIGHLRGDPLEARIPDAVAPGAVLGAWLLGAVRRRRPGATPFSASALLLVPPAALIWMSCAAVGNLGGRLDQLGIRGGPSLMAARAVRTVERLRAPPLEVAGLWSDNAALAGYVNLSTRPTDRLLVTGVAPDIFYFSGRGFAGGLSFFLPGYWSSLEDQERIIARLERNPPPIVLVEVDSYPFFAPAFALVDRYLAEHYRLARVVANHAGREYRVLTDIRRTPTGTYAPLGLPSFGDPPPEPRK